MAVREGGLFPSHWKVYVLSSMPRTVLKVCGGGWWVVGAWWWLRPILVFSLSLDQAEQLAQLQTGIW